jgi:hypothetical protein
MKSSILKDYGSVSIVSTSRRTCIPLAFNRVALLGGVNMRSLYRSRPGNGSFEGVNGNRASGCCTGSVTSTVAKPLFDVKARQI